MQMQFPKTAQPCLRRLKSQTLSQEQTQELRLTEDMPDAGTILGAWGQPLIRGKSWNRGSMELSCGVMVWAMYRPEGEEEPCMVEGWLPFQFRWDMPETDRDGVMAVNCLVRSVDARITSARRLLLRATLDVLGEGWVNQEIELCVPEEVPADVCLLQQTYPVCLPREAGEKAFSLDEELTLPSSAPKLQKLLRFSLQPELTDHKVMGDKVVFRGAALLHMLYRTPEGSLATWDFEIPFSQYNDLDQSYDQATAAIMLAVTALELEEETEHLHLKAGLTGQYRIDQETPLCLVEDAYSPQRHLNLERETLLLPALLEEQSQLVTAQAPIPQDGVRVVDMAFYPHSMALFRKEDGVEGNLEGYFQTLYYDGNGQLQGGVCRWQSPWKLPISEDAAVTTRIRPSGTAQASSTDMRGDLVLDLQTMDTQGFSMVTALELGEIRQPDPDRPSLILRRLGEDTLWELAKATNSTVEAIRKANGLTGQPSADQMLLIPIP